MIYHVRQMAAAQWIEVMGPAALSIDTAIAEIEAALRDAKIEPRERRDGKIVLRATRAHHGARLLVSPTTGDVIGVLAPHARWVRRR